MTEAQTWDVFFKWMALIGVTFGGLGGAWKYFQQRSGDRQLRTDELRWKKAEFIFKLADEFEKDERYRRALQMIDSGLRIPTGSSLERVLATTGVDGLTTEEKSARYDIDRYLDFFDRLYAFVMVMHSLDLDDIRCFEGYMTDIRDSKKCLNDYAMTFGYDNVIELANRLAPADTKRAAMRRRHQLAHAPS